MGWGREGAGEEEEEEEERRSLKRICRDAITIGIKPG